VTPNEATTLAKLLLKYRSLEFVSHRKRDLIDEIVISLIEMVERLNRFEVSYGGRQSDGNYDSVVSGEPNNDIPF